MTEADPTGRKPGDDGAKLDAGKAPIVRGVIQYFPRALKAVAEVSGFGAEKYHWGGWKSVPDGVDRYADAGMRHRVYEAMGEVYDPDSKLLHKAHAAWNALAELERFMMDREAEAAELEELLTQTTVPKEQFVSMHNGADVLGWNGPPRHKRPCHCRDLDRCLCDQGIPLLSEVLCRKAEEGR